MQEQRFRIIWITRMRFLLIGLVKLKRYYNKIMNTEKESEPSCLGAVISRFNSDIFIDNVCLSYRHDFGLMAEQDKQRLRFECKEWMRAISNNWEYFKNGL
jgi:hypothetical protein